MNRRDLIFESIEYSDVHAHFGAARKARIVFRVVTRGDLHTYSLPLTCIVDDSVSEDDMIAYARSELQGVINQVGSATR